MFFLGHRGASFPTDHRDTLHTPHPQTTRRVSLQSPRSEVYERQAARVLKTYLKLTSSPQHRREPTPPLLCPPPLRRDAPSSPLPPPRDWSYARDALFAREVSQQSALGARGTAAERKHGLSTEPFPVSAYGGSSKNLQDLKNAAPAPRHVPAVHTGVLVDVDALSLFDERDHEARRSHVSPYVYDSWGASHPMRPSPSEIVTPSVYGSWSPTHPMRPSKPSQKEMREMVSETVSSTHRLVLSERRRLPPSLLLAPLSP